MLREARCTACVVFLAAAFLPVPARADSQWIKARLGSFETISDNGRRSAIQALSQFEQFRFALGAAMGKPDLKLDPPLRIVVFKNAQEMPPACTGLLTGRDHLMACVAGQEGKDNQLPAQLVRQLTLRLLEENFSNLPIPIERALETFFSTVQSNAVHVTWGAPPPHDERTREWALLHMLITQPEYSGRAHIYLHNLANGMDSNGAIRSLSEGPAKFNAAVDAYYIAGDFKSTAAPNRALNTERDFSTTGLTSDEGQLMRADLLMLGSTAIYQSLLQSGKHVAEDNEGLAILAMRAGDTEQARHYMEAARSAGTQNFIALTSFGSLEKDPERAIAILKEALTLDPKYAEAHWALGEKISDKPRRMMEWKQAVALAPRNYQWWEQYARLCIDQKQYAEAGRAWLAAAQAAPDIQHKEQYLASRGQIDQLRLDDEEAVRRREAAARAAEIDRLKNQARKELADLEARANGKPLSKEELARTVDWTDIHGSAKLTGTLVKVQCVARQFQLDIKDEIGKVQRLVVADPAMLEITGGDGTLSCGANQKPRAVVITYKPTTDRKGFSGEVTGIEFP
jgi:tetratricopeptide (TPR) repeat protein